MPPVKKTKLPVISFTEDQVHPDNQSPRAKGPVCGGCALEKEPRVFGTGAAAPVDIMLVSEAPSMFSANNQRHFSGKGGQIIRKTWQTLVEADAVSKDGWGFGRLKRFETYAVQCQVGEQDTIASKTIDRCSVYLHSAIKNKKPKIILALGATALRAVGVRFNKFDDVRGRVMKVPLAGDDYCLVLPTFSTKAILARMGLFNLFRADMVRAMRIATGKDEVFINTDIATVTKNYKIPKTVEEVRDVCREIVQYADAGGDPQNWTIAVDTETNTLHPEREHARVLCVSFAWGEGKATAIPLWHKDAKWKAEEVLPYVREVLESSKPKVFHNAKFDLKFLELRHGLRVNNYAWCTLAGEHLLREDQQGAYSLKVLARSFFPQFSNYADHIHDVASALSEADGMIEEIIDHHTGKGKKGNRYGKLPPFGMEEVPSNEMSAKELREYYFGTSDERKARRKEDVNYEKVPIEDLLLYAAIDTDLTRRLIKHQFMRIRQERCDAVKTLGKTHAVPASRTLGKMEYGGMRVDVPYLDTLEKDLDEVIAAKDKELRQYFHMLRDSKTGRDLMPSDFNPNSTQHVEHILYSWGVIQDFQAADVLNHSNRKTRYINDTITGTTKTGRWKTDKKTLKAIEKEFNCNFATSLLHYRAAHKARNGFLKEVRRLSAYDGRLHTSFHLHGTKTGRLSSSDLNMQNIPAGKLAGHNIKKLFIPDTDDELILNLDYRGAEIRIFAAYSRDEKLIEALLRGLDAHSFFTEKLYGHPYEEVEAAKDYDFKGAYARGVPAVVIKRMEMLKAARTNIKRVVFGVLYGAQAKKIAETAGNITPEEAQKVIDDLFAMFPSIPSWIEQTKNFIYQNGYVETFFSRRRRFPLHHVNKFFRSQGERQGVNMLIQATSNDIVLGQLVELDQHIHEVGGRLCITVHDSIVASIPKKNVQQLPDFLNYYCVKRVSEKYPWLPVPFACDIQVGPSYGETVDLGEYLKTQAAESRLTEDDTFDQEVLDELRDEDAGEATHFGGELIEMPMGAI